MVRFGDPCGEQPKEGEEEACSVLQYKCSAWIFF